MTPRSSRTSLARKRWHENGGLVEDAGAQPRAAAPYKPDGEMRWALYVTLAPLWFDPGEVTGFITPFWSSMPSTMRL